MVGKIYPQYIKGKYRRIKDYLTGLLMLLYFGGSWLTWNRGEGYPDQALFIDLPNRHAYLFGIEIWPEEVYYITGALILAALGLFFVTSLFGRVWCGYTCPHTVFTDIFLKIEHFFQGDRNSRIKHDSMPMDRNLLIRKIATHVSWMGVGFLFAFGWVCYFYRAKQLVCDLLTLNVSFSAAVWLVSLTASTYLFAGFLRQRVCMYMCPYGRFQSAMLDDDTTLVTYNTLRGEPRKNSLNESEKVGDCIDCNKCVVVCPMGIDIRDGLQMECIGCGLCIDACNSVMEKLNKPLSLIGYMSAKEQKHTNNFLKQILKAKSIIFLFVFFIVSGFMIYGLIHKETYKLSVLRDRGALYTVTPDGSIRNTYFIKIFNKSNYGKELELSMEGIENLEFLVQDKTTYADHFIVTIKPEEELEYKVFAKVPDSDYSVTQKEINFILKDLSSGETIIKQNAFVVSR